MKNSYVTDTMALVLRLEHRRMGNQAKSIYELVETGKICLDFIVSDIASSYEFFRNQKCAINTPKEFYKEDGKFLCLSKKRQDLPN
jgi:hypothetical protein